MTTLILNAAEARVQFVLAQAVLAQAVPAQIVPAQDLNQDLGCHQAHDPSSKRTPAPVCAQRIVCAQDWDAPSKGTELLPPLLKEALAHAGLCMSDVQRIACVAGPGSFTGLRLVLTLAAGLRRATGAQVASLNYLQAIAQSFAAGLASPCNARVITHARRGLVHCQDFALPCTDNALARPLTAPHMCTLQQAGSGFIFQEVDSGLIPENTGNSTTPYVLLGSGVTRNPEAFAQLPPHVRPLVGACQYPTAQALLDLTREAVWGHTDPDPLYLRPCDAVDNLAAIATKRGQEPAEAQAELERLLKKF